MAPNPEPASIVLPAGPPLLEAAAWVGWACWTELRLHELLGAWIVADDGGSAEERVARWSVRSTRAAAAEAWHRRLPELREFPREGFIAPRTPGHAGLLDELAAVSGSERPGALAASLASLAEGYRVHAELARGPADGPTAATLAAARTALDADLARLSGPSPGWRERWTAVGELP